MKIKLREKHLVVALPQLMIALLFGAGVLQVESRPIGGHPKSFVCDFRNVGDPSTGSQAFYATRNLTNFIQGTYQDLCIRKGDHCFEVAKEKVSERDGADARLSAGFSKIESSIKDLLPPIKTSPDLSFSAVSNHDGIVNGAGAHISLVDVTSAAGTASPYLGWVLIILAFVFLEMCRACCSISRYREELAKSKDASRDLNVPCNDTAANKLDDTDMSDVHLENQ